MHLYMSDRTTLPLVVYKVYHMNPLCLMSRRMGTLYSKNLLSIFTGSTEFISFVFGLNYLGIRGIKMCRHNRKNLEFNGQRFCTIKQIMYVRFILTFENYS